MRKYEEKPCASCGQMFGPRVRTKANGRRHYRWDAWDKAVVCSTECRAQHITKPWCRAGEYMYARAPGHPRATKEGRVMYHRLVVESKLGRYLRPDEEVHHVNGDPRDNRPENLCVLPWQVHRKIQRSCPN